MKKTVTNATLLNVAFYIFIIINSFNLQGQTKVYGKIIDTNNLEVSSAIIYIKSKKSNNTILHTISDESGKYSININTIGNYFLVISHIGYTNEEIEIRINQTN